MISLTSCDFSFHLFSLCLHLAVAALPEALLQSLPDGAMAFTFFGIGQICAN